MLLHRRSLLMALPTLLLASTVSWAEDSLPAIRAYEHDSGGHLGLYVENLATGATLAWRADQRFVMCSTFKASLAGLVLSRVDRGQDHLESRIAYGAADLSEWAPVARANLASGSLSVAEMCAGAVEQSDNTCANLLLARLGGPAALTSFWRSLGDRVTRLDHNEPLLNRSPAGDSRDTTTPRAMAGVLRQLAVGDALSARSRERFVGWLVGCQTGANRLRAGLPSSWKIGDKTGNNGKDAYGDIAVAWPGPIVICAYTRGGTPTAPQVEAVFHAIGAAVGSQLARP
jgi:beta-lactamase class A